MASCVSNRLPLFCSLERIRPCSRAPEEPTFWGQGLTMRRKTCLRQRGLHSRQVGCNYAGLTQTAVVSVPAHRLLRPANDAKCFLFLRDLSLPHETGFGGGVVNQNLQGLGRLGASLDGQGADRRSNDEERIQSGRAASTSGSNPSAKGGRKAQQKVPPGPLKSTGAGSKGDEKGFANGGTNRGRDVLNNLIGVQAAWPSGPLFAMAREKKNAEIEVRNAQLRDRIRALKETAGLGESGVNAGAVGVNAGAGVVNGVGREEAGEADRVDQEVTGERVGLGGPKMTPNAPPGVQNGRPSTSEEKSWDSHWPVALTAGESEHYSAEELAEEDGAASLSGSAVTPSERMRDEPSLDVDLVLDGEGESDNGSVRELLESSQNGHRGKYTVPETLWDEEEDLWVEGENGAPKVNGVEREDFLQRLEQVQKGLGASAKSLANGEVVGSAAPHLRKVKTVKATERKKTQQGLGALDELSKAEGGHVGRGAALKARRALKGVGIQSTAAEATKRAALLGGQEMHGEGAPQDAETRAGGSEEWAAGPPKRDANAAVAQMVASSKRFQRLRQLAHASVKRGEVSRLDSRPSAAQQRGVRVAESGTGQREGLEKGMAAMERLEQSQAEKGEGDWAGQGLEPGQAQSSLASREDAGLRNAVDKYGAFGNGVAANGRASEDRAEKAKERATSTSTKPAKGEWVTSDVETSSANGAAKTELRNGVAKDGFATAASVVGAVQNGFVSRKGLAAPANGHATAGAPAAGKVPLENGAVGKAGWSTANGAASGRRETERGALNGRAEKLLEPTNGLKSSATRRALSADAELRVNGAAQPKENGALYAVGVNGAASRRKAASEGARSSSVAGESNGFAGSSEALRTPEWMTPGLGEELPESVNGKLLAGVLNGAASKERASLARAEGQLSRRAGSANGAASKSTALLVAEMECNGALSGLMESVAVTRSIETGADVVLAESGSSEGLSSELSPPVPKKRKSATSMIGQSVAAGDPSTGRSDVSQDALSTRGPVPGGPGDPPVLVSASRKIGEEAQAIAGGFSGGGGAKGVSRKHPKNYTLEEDEKLFEALGARLTGQELSRIEEWLRSREVPELKLQRPRDRTGRYFLIPIIEAVEKHLRAHGRLQSEEESLVAPIAVTLAEATRGGESATRGGENRDEFFRKMSEELSADVILQTRELLASQDAPGGSEAPRNEPPTEKKAEFSDFFADDSSESDVETLFQRAGLSTGGRRQRELGSLERVVIAEYLLGLNKQGGDPPRKDAWPCSPDGERYSKETLRRVWREADEMGGLPAYLKMCREEEAIERLLIESLSRGLRLAKNEGWRDLSSEETRVVEAMEAVDRVGVLEFMLRILEGGEALDWKKHRDIWPRRKRTAHLLKSHLLLAVVKMACRRGGLEAYLEECRREAARNPEPTNGLRLAAANSFEPFDDLLGSDADNPGMDDEPSAEPSTLRIRRLATGGLRGAELDPPSPAASAPAGERGWRAASVARGLNSGANGPPAGGVQGWGLGPSRTDGPATPSPLFSSKPDPVDRPSPVDPDPSKIPRGFPVRRPKEPVQRDPSIGFATWRVPSAEAPPQIGRSSTPPQTSAYPRRKGMIQSAADRVALSPLADGALFPGDDPPQQNAPPPAEKPPGRRWPGFYDPKPAPEVPEGPVPQTFDLPPSVEPEPAGVPAGNGASRELPPIERRRRRRLLGIKVQRGEDDVSRAPGDDVSRGPGGVFEVVGRQPRSMREILSGYSQETVLVRAQEIAQPVLVEDNLRSADEEGLLERMVAGNKSDLEEFKDTSKQYMRAWQDFQTWSDFFQHKNKRLPTVTDVEATCIPWLIEKAKAYVVLRKHMIKLAEGNEKLLTAMAAIQAELNKRNTASIAAEKSTPYQPQAKPVSRRPVKRRPRARKQHADPVAGAIIDELDSEDDF